MVDVHDVSNCLLSLSAPEAGDGIPNLKLKKLLYYCQGLNLALRDAPLFDSVIEAWEHGPVVPIIYRKYKKHGWNHIPIPNNVSLEKICSNDGVKEVVDEAYNFYGQFSAWKLRNMTHREPPWRDTPKGDVITLEKLKEYFSTLVEEVSTG